MLNMDEKVVLKVLNEFGVDNITDDDYKVYEEYFCRRNESLSSDDSSDEQSDTDASVNLASASVDLFEVSLLSGIPTLEDVGEDIVNIDDVIIEIERDVEADVVDENDAGQPLVVPDDYNNMPPVFDTDIDFNTTEAFLENGCGCQKNCCRQWQADELVEMRRNCAEIDFYENNVNKLDQVILGQLHCLTRKTSMTNSKHKKQSQRQKSRCMYLLQGLEICRETFMFAHNIKMKRFKRLTKVYNGSGLIAKQHGNAGKMAKNVTTHKKIEYVVRFLTNYAEQHALILPGRASTVYNANLKLLPSNETVRTVYEKYAASFNRDITEKPISKRLFRNIWRETCRDIVIMKPRSDLCATCQQHYTSGAKMAMATDEEKIETLQKMTAHLDLVAKERKFYKDIIQRSKETFQGKESSVPNSCSIDATVHYSFDMAQQVHIPSNPLQPGPIYFLVPFKIGIYGVMCETTNKQANYLIPESVNVGKGSNLIVSMFHHYLENFSHGEKTMHIHADNCVGQNKNNILIGYLAWRVCKNMNQKIVLSFLPVGHTKFSCDWGFGLFKKKFRTTHVSSVDELVETVAASTPTSKVNFGIAVGDERGNTNVSTYNWLSFLANYRTKKIPNITKFNHFEFENTHKGVVICKFESDGNSYVHRVFPSDDGPAGFPDRVVPNGLSDDRKKYLFTNIRQYCKDEYKDLLCPALAISVPDRPTSREEEEVDQPAPRPGPSRQNKRKRPI